MKHKSEIVSKAADYIFLLFKDKLSPKYLYHNYRHAIDTTEVALDIADDEDLDKDQVEILMLAAWFHDTGYTVQYEGHEEKSAEIAKEFLLRYNYPEDKIKQVEELIRSTSIKQAPANLMQEILHDADYSSVGKKSFFSKAELLRVEWEVFLDKKYDDYEWDQSQLDFLMNKSFFTHYAQKRFGPQREKNIQKQRDVIGKSIVIKKDKKGSPKSGRGVETMFRTTYRNHMVLSSMADSKANMMISINTIIMSVIMSVVGGGITLMGKSSFDTLKFTVPICILLLTCLISVIFAIISARPQVTKRKEKNEGEGSGKEQSLAQEKKSSLLFFGNFSKMSLPDFVGQMSDLMNDADLLYNNMIVDIYYLGHVLTRKYALLRASYMVFLLGFVLSVLSFLAVFAFSYQSFKQH
jgi:predicted metal-dependent HD superfamily phosphohydrolase